MGIYMKKCLLLVILLFLPAITSAQPGYIEVNAPGNRQLKLAVETLRSRDLPASPDVANLAPGVITFDLNMSGVVTAEPHTLQPNATFLPLVDVDFAPVQGNGFDLLVRG